MEHIVWCSGCSAEPAIEMFEIEWYGDFVSFPVGQECLTRAGENGTIER
jgi:hypothetical protein